MGKNYTTAIDLYGRNSIETYDQGVLMVGFEKDDHLVGGRMVLIKTDRNGEELFRKTIGEIENRVVPLVLETKDKGFILYGLDSSNDIGNSFVMKFNACYELEWTSIFGVEGEYDFIWDIVELNDGSFYAACFFASNRIRLIKISSTGEVESEKNFLPNGYDAEIGRDYSISWARKIIKTKDAGFLLTGSIYIDEPTVGGHIVKSFVLKVDSLGEREWLYAFGVDSNRVNNQAISLELADSSILVLCNYLHYPGVEGTASYCYKLSKEGNLLWHRIIDPVQGQSHMDAKLLDDSTVILLTSIGVPDDPWVGRPKVMKIDTTGAILDSATFAQDVHSTVGERLDITSDREILICGQQFDNVIASAYILKLREDLSIDSFNTEVLDYDYLCDKKIETSHMAFDTALSIISINQKEYKLKVFPNPAKDVVHFELENTELFKYSISLFDINGVLVHKEERSSQNLNPISVQKLAKGNYFYKLIYKNRTVATEKFVKI